MAPGGKAIIPMPQGDPEALLPNTFISLWPYVNLADGRIRFGSKYSIVQQDCKCGPAKIGCNCEDGWIAYQNKGVTFIKKYEHFVDAEYPDNSFLIFGREDAGLPEELLYAHPDECVRIPMRSTLRSLNLSNSAAIAVYEVLRQWGYPDLETKGQLTKFSW